MRKATVLKRGSRKKQPNGSSVQEPNDERPVPPLEAPVPKKRQPSEDEIALTSKNYRLAKELVRHIALQLVDFLFVIDESVTNGKIDKV